MFDLVDDLGLDPETIEWFDVAACQNMDLNWFYDDYEKDEIVAKQIDQVCLHCPVMNECAKFAQQNNEIGVWGSIYWDGNGKPDKIRNKHKTEEIWKDIMKRAAV